MQPAPPNPRRPHLLLAAVVVTLLAVYGSFVPLDFKSLTWDDAVARFRDVPLLKLGVYKRADLVANLVLFVPLGFFWLGAIDLDRRSRVPALVAAPMIALSLGALAVAVEFTQQWTVRRTVSQNDMISEAIGGVVGLIAWLVAGRWMIGKVRGVLSAGAPVATVVEQRAVMILRLRGFLILYAVGFILYNIQPLDIAVSAQSLRQKHADGRVLLIPFASLAKSDLFNALWQSGSDILLFLPIGMLMRLGHHHLRSLAMAVFLCAAGAVLVELAQLFVFSRYVDTTDLFTSTLGGILGAWLLGRLAQEPEEDARKRDAGRRRLIAAMLCFGYTIPLLVFSWEPFTRVASMEVFWDRLRGAINPPFSGHYFGTEFNALTKVMRDVMYFVPYGALIRWACAGSDRLAGGRILVTFIGVVLGVVIETGQAAIVGRYADLTSVVLNILGAWAGWWVWGLLFREPPLISQKFRPEWN